MDMDLTTPNGWHNNISLVQFPINRVAFEHNRVYAFFVAIGFALCAPSVESFNLLSLLRILFRLVMSSTSYSTNSVAHIESSDVTCTASGSARDVSGLDDSKSDGPSYEWVDPCVLDIPTCFRDSQIFG